MIIVDEEYKSILMVQKEMTGRESSIVEWSFVDTSVYKRHSPFRMYKCSKAKEPNRIMQMYQPKIQLERLIHNNEAFRTLQGITDEQEIDRFLLVKSIFMYVPQGTPILAVDQKFYPRDRNPPSRAPRRHAPHLLKEKKLTDITNATHIEMKGSHANYRVVQDEKVLWQCMTTVCKKKEYYSSYEVLPNRVKLLVEYDAAKDHRWLRRDVVRKVQAIVRESVDDQLECYLFRIGKTRFRIVFPCVVINRDDDTLMRKIEGITDDRIRIVENVYEKGYVSMYGSYQPDLDYTVTLYGFYDNNGDIVQPVPNTIEIIRATSFTNKNIATTI